MKYILLVLIMPVTLCAMEDKEQLISQSQKNLLMKHIIHPNAVQFENQFNHIFFEIKEEKSKTSKNYLNFQKPTNLSFFKFFTKKESSISKDDAIKELKEKANYKKCKLVNDLDKTNVLVKKSKSAGQYFFAAFALFGLGILSSNRSLDANDNNFLQPIVFENWLQIHPTSLIPIEPNTKNTIALFGLSFIPTYLGLKDIYNGIFYKYTVQKNIDENEKISSFLKKKKNL